MALELAAGLLNLVSAGLLLLAGWYIQVTFPMLLPIPLRLMFGLALIWYFLSCTRSILRSNRRAISLPQTGSDGTKYSLDFDR